MILMGWAGSFLFRKQMILLLLNLELVLLGNFVLFVIVLSHISVSVSFSLYLLILGVVEAMIGLSLLVIISSQLGTDMMKTPSLSWLRL